MRLDQALDILYGELVNSPCISAFNNVAYSIEQVSSGTLFFALNSNDVESAIANGAYGIVFEGDMPYNDNEIALIKVQNITQSMRRFIRYLLLESKYTLVILTPIEIALAKSLQAGFPIINSNTLQDCLIEIFKLYKDSMIVKDEQSMPFCNILLTSIQELENLDIYTCFSLQYSRGRLTNDRSVFAKHDMEKEIPRRYYKHCNIVSYGLFESKIIWEGMLYKIALPYILLPFMESLMAVFAFLKKEYWESYIAAMGGLYARESKTTHIVSGTHIRSFNPRLPKYMQGDISIKGLHLEDLGFCYLDSYGRLSTTTQTKSLLFCSNPTLFTCQSLQERDLGYNSNIQHNAHIIFESLRKNRGTNLLTEYLKVHASHLNTLSCYGKGIKFPKATQKNISIPYAHLNHLAQILTKMPFHLAIIYGISKKAFEKAAILPKHTKKQEHRTIHAISQPPDLFSVNGMQI